MPYPEAIAHYPKSARMFIKKIHNRVESGKNALIAVVGGTGSGKSWSTISIMMGLDLYRHGKTNSYEWYLDHFIFRALDLMNGLNDKDLKKKTNWLWDEAGVDAGTAEHATVKNKVIGWLGQTFRNLQQVVFFTLPGLGMLTPQIRKLLHFYLEAISIDKKVGMCVMKPLEMQYNTRMDKIYYHNISFITKEGYVEEVDKIAVPKAPQELLDMYELKKSKFTVDLNIKIALMLQKIENKNNMSELDKLTPLQKEINEAIMVHNKTNNTDIAQFLKVDPYKISSNLQYMGRKGFRYPNLTRKNAFLGFKAPKDPTPILTSIPNQSEAKDN